MLGTLIGDMAGSRFEFNNVRRKKIFQYMPKEALLRMTQ